MCGRTRRLRTGKRVRVAGNLLHVSSYQEVKITPSVEHMQLVKQHAKRCLSYFVYIMSWEKKYQALPAHTYLCSGVGEPRDEAITNYYIQSENPKNPIMSRIRLFHTN